MKTLNQTRDSGEYEAPEMKKKFLKNFKIKLRITIAALIAVILYYLLNFNITKPPEQAQTYKSYEVDKAPECINLAIVKSAIVYPPKALESGEEGVVYVKVLVGNDGKVKEVGSMTGPEVFYDEIKDKAKNLEFTPGLQNGKPVKVWITIPFRFKLKN